MVVDVEATATLSTLSATMADVDAQLLLVKQAIAQGLERHLEQISLLTGNNHKLNASIKEHARPESNHGPRYGHGAMS